MPNKPDQRPYVAVIFGGKSPEHDVSILTGLQVLEAINPQKFRPFPVYVGLDGQWWCGDALRERKNFLPSLALKRQLTRVEWAIGNCRGHGINGGSGVLRAVTKPWLGQAQEYPVDIVLPALHGSWGEDGTLQALFAAESIPCVGGGVGAMALTINKLHSLQIAAAHQVPVLPSLLVLRGTSLIESEVNQKLGKFPLFIKPNFLGSSIGAQKIHDAQELLAAQAVIDRLDTAAIIQPYVANLVEYNVAIRRSANGDVLTSAIERPLRKGEALSFFDKYLSNGGIDKLGQKLGTKTTSSEGMAGSSRVLNPTELKPKQRQNIEQWAKTLFVAFNLAGTPRFDFMMNSKTGDLWFTEVNPLPGSFSYFLWDAADKPIGFTELLDELLAEATMNIRTQFRMADPVSTGGAFFRQRG
jgi:D-alanine-D-alanine ligase